jgi:hypothetical protein
VFAKAGLGIEQEVVDRVARQQRRLERVRVAVAAKAAQHRVGALDRVDLALQFDAGRQRARIESGRQRQPARGAGSSAPARRL